MREFWRMFKYGIVGVISLGIHVGSYALLSRVFWVEGNRTFEFFIAVSFASVFNFTFHKLWTFDAKGFDSGMIARYLFVVISGTAINSGLFYLGHEVFGIYDFYVLFGTVVVVALYQYISHRQFTFHSRFDQKVVVVETHEHTIGADFEEQRDSVEVRIEEESGAGDIESRPE
jgi:putative flippase GtrA